MTLPRKGSRKLRVDGENYRWTIRRRPTYCEANEWSKLSAAVELFDQPTSVLLIEFPFFRPDSWVSMDGGQVTPAMIEESIRDAIRDGWNPRTPGPVFKHDARVL